MPHLVKDLPLPFEAVHPVLVDLPHRVLDRIPMAREEHSGVEGGQLLQRAQVRGHVALRVSDHRAAAAEDQVAGEHGSVAGKPEAEVIRAVARGVERGHVERSDSDHILIA